MREQFWTDPTLIAAVTAAAVLLVILGWWSHRRSARRRALREVLDDIAFDRMQDVFLPDGLDGEIHLDHLLLTSRGLLVLQVKEMDGLIFSGERLDTWHAMHARGRFSFRNPLPDLQARVASVRSLAPNLPVVGRVVFIGDGDFHGTPPVEVCGLETLRDSFRPDDGSEARTGTSRRTDAFQHEWEKVRAGLVEVADG